MIHLQLILDADPHADPMQRAELARDLRDLLRRELAAPVTIRSADHLRSDSGDIARGDPVAIAALILAIPGAALALDDLAARTRLTDCLRRVLTWARERRARATWRVAADRVALPGDAEPTLDEIIDELVRAQARSD